MKKNKPTAKELILTKYPDIVYEQLEEDGTYSVIMKTKSCHFKLGSGKDQDSAWRASMKAAGI